MTRAAENPSVLSTRRGKLILALLCSVAFIDSVDAVIVNVALPSIQRGLGFPDAQGLQWVATGYLLAYGGLMLLGGRAADLIGRRRVLVTGVILFALASLVGGLAPTAALLVGARIVQGAGAALMMPAALSLVTTLFEGPARHRAIGIWGGVIGLATAAGVLLGGVLTDTVGWRAILLINPIIGVVILAAIFRLLPDDRRRAPHGFDVLGAVLSTSGLVLLVWAVVEAPHAGWGSLNTIVRLAGAVLLLVAFVANESRAKTPLLPLSIFRLRGVAAANLVQLVAIAGLYGWFFVVTLYMQDVLGYSPLAAGLAYLPATAGIAVGALATTKLIPRVGTRPVIVSGSVIASVGVLLMSFHLPVHGHYAADLLPGLIVMSVGLGFVLASVTNAATAGVPIETQGLAAAMVTCCIQLGGAMGIAVLTTVATSRTTDLLAAGAPTPDATTGGFSRALLVGGLIIAAAAVIGLRTNNTRSTEASV